MTATTIPSSAFPHRFSQLPVHFAAFVEALSQEELGRLYRSHGRIWLDTGDFQFRLTFGPPTDRGAHSWMREEPSAGIWVSLGLDMGTHEDHPCDEGGIPVDWVPAADWIRSQLHYIQDDFSESLRYVAEAAEASSQEES